MPVRKTDKGWMADVRPAGRDGRRFRKLFATKAEALNYEKWVISEHKDDDPWERSKKKDSRKLTDIADDWYKYHGKTLATGEKRLSVLKTTIKALGNPLAIKADPLAFLEYRSKRLESGTSENHLNHELTYLKAMFNVLISVDNWKLPNPYGKVKKLKFDQRELSFLTLKQVNKLLSALEAGRNKHVKTISRICLSTGCRWGEAEGLEAKQIHHGKIHFTKTKNGLNRSVPITDELKKEILNGRPKEGRLFTSSEEAFENALERANIELPKGQKTHVLRHTFASHFMMSGGNILDLNKILGHRTIQMTMTYAHLAPEHLVEAKARNPIELASKNKRGHNVDKAANEENSEAA